MARLFRVDHANTRIRRQAENLLVLAGLRVEDAGRQVTTLLDVVRAAASAIEHFSRIEPGRVVDLAVAEFAADDTIRILTELLDNAARFSPRTSRVTVSAYVTDGGHVLVRVEDAGVGVDPTRLEALNAMLNGGAPPTVSADAAAWSGLVVVRRLAMAQRLRVWLTPRQPGGTTAHVLIPSGVLCEIPVVRASSTEPVRQLRAVRPRRPETVRATAAVGVVDSGAMADRADPPLPIGDGGGPRHGRDGVAGLPRRSPTSLRPQKDPARPRADRPPSAALQSWHEDVGDVAAGIEDARRAHRTPIEGHV